MSSTRNARRPRKWTSFELDCVLALICKGVHQLSYKDFASLLNEALNGSSQEAFEKDIPLRDVKELLCRFEHEKKGALAFIERQPHPHRITRTKKIVFQRNLKFDGTMREWIHEGRKEAVEAKKKKLEALGGTMTKFTNSAGVVIERWQPGDDLSLPRLTDTWMPAHDDVQRDRLLKEQLGECDRIRSQPVVEGSVSVRQQSTATGTATHQQGITEAGSPEYVPAPSAPTSSGWCSFAPPTQDLEPVVAHPPRTSSTMPPQQQVQPTTSLNYGKPYRTTSEAISSASHPTTGFQQPHTYNGGWGTMPIMPSATKSDTQKDNQKENQPYTTKEEQVNKSQDPSPLFPILI